MRFRMKMLGALLVVLVIGVLPAARGAGGFNYVSYLLGACSVFCLACLWIAPPGEGS